MGGLILMISSCQGWEEFHKCIFQQTEHCKSENFPQLVSHTLEDKALSKELWTNLSLKVGDIFYGGS